MTRVIAVALLLLLSACAAPDYRAYRIVPIPIRPGQCDVCDVVHDADLLAELKWQQRLRELEERRKWREENL
jgi:hypothetical protein